jgi:ribosome-associated toxin RatA of RatAB toxin-antitoxin module
MVDAPAAAVMSVLQDYARYKDFLPNFQASRVLSQRGTSALVYLQVSVLHGASKIWVEVKLHERPAQGATRTIEGTMMRGNVDRFEAVWQVTPFDPHHSVVSFQLLVDPNMPVPATLVNDENQKNARKALRALRATLAERAQRASLGQGEIAVSAPATK